jgi:uncharacterized protein (TIGR00730 family)
VSKSICVYCASSEKVDDIFFESARRMGTLLAEGGCTLVYGGGSIGLMGAMARAVHAGHGRVVGVIPDSMVEKELAYHEADELIVTGTMLERKAAMAERADAFVALPGGFGTLEELFEVLTHRQLRYHDKPIVIVNVAGYYDPLLALFEHMIENHFAKPRHRQSYCVVTSPDQVLDRI